jgi:choice-of-anchor A domain-containing protein
MHFGKLLLLLAALSAVSAPAWADPFGPASAYNLVALGSSTYAGNITTGADVGGRVLAAGTVSSGQYGSTIGSSVVNDAFGGSLTNAIVTAGGLTAGSTFYINGGGNVSTPTQAGTIYFNDHGSRVTSTGPVIDFASLRTNLEAESAALNILAQTNAITPRSGNSSLGENPSFTVLQGTAAVNYFNISAAQFQSGTLDIEVPTGATAIINVTGTSATLGTAIYLNGQQYHGDSANDQDILFNFASATSVDLSAGLDASVLAPFALLTDNNGQIDGNFIAAQIQLTGNAEAHNVEFSGTVPPTSPSPVPEPTSLALMSTGIASLATILRRRNKTRIN